MFKFEAPKDEKAMFRIGAKVTHDYHPNEIFKVTNKFWYANGVLEYALESTDGLITMIGVRQKVLNKVSPSK